MSGNLTPDEEWHDPNQTLNDILSNDPHTNWIPTKHCINCNSVNLLFHFSPMLGYDAEVVKCTDCKSVFGGANFWEFIGEFK